MRGKRGAVFEKSRGRALPWGKNRLDSGSIEARIRATLDIMEIHNV